MMEKEEEYGLWGLSQGEGQLFAFCPRRQALCVPVCAITGQDTTENQTGMDLAINVEKEKQRHGRSAVKEATRGQERIRTESHLVLIIREGLKEQL